MPIYIPKKSNEEYFLYSPNRDQNRSIGPLLLGEHYKKKKRENFNLRILHDNNINYELFNELNSNNRNIITLSPRELFNLTSTNTSSKNDNVIYVKKSLPEYFYDTDKFIIDLQMQKELQNI